MGDIRTTIGEKPPKTLDERQRRIRKNIFVVILVTAAIIAFLVIVKAPRRVPASGYVTTEGYAEIRSAVSGRVKEVLVFTGDAVKKGDVLVRLEDEAELAAVGEALRQVAKGEAELAMRETRKADDVRRHENAVKAAEMELNHAKERLSVTEQLHAKGLASGRQLSEDKFSLEKWAETLRALKEIDMTVADREIEVLKKDIEVRQETLSGMKAALEQRTIRASIDGNVSRYTFYVGEMIRPDVILYEIFDGDADLLKFRIPERYAGDVHVGMKLDVRVGTVRTMIPTRFHGEVTDLRNVVEGDGDKNYRVAYGKFDLDGEFIPPGTSAEIRVRVGKSSLLSLLFRP